MPAHSFLGLGGIVDICPEVLNFELHWSHWTSTVLFAFDTARLRSLTIPVRSPSDCIRIRLALKRMPNLESLTIKEIPDIQDFIDRFHHLGRGILALAPTLRALSLSLTNMNRKSDWEKDEAFVEPDDLAFFFKHFFPEPTPRDIAMLARRRFLDPREDTDINILQSTKGPLNIETMELRHIGLPWWAFQTVFNPSTIKTLSLPKCKVEPTVWDDLGSWCKLITLTRISYDMLPGAFLRFLSAQNELRALSFMRPCHKYDLVDVSFEWNQLTAIMGLAVVEPSMGPGTAWGRARARDAWHNSMGGLWNDYYHYPKRSAFVSALSHKRSLKHLVLPPNMFDVTPAFLAYLAIELPALENLELGFDYDCPELREAFLGTFLPTLPHMKKITLLSLSRPEPLSSFDAWQSFFPVLNLHSNCRIPSTLKYIRYCGLPNSDGRTRSLVYYHRENPVNGMWWLAIRGREGRRVYEDGTTPSISSSRRCNKKGALQGYGFEGKLGSCRDDFLRG